ncbi:hypothetical protein [uncultured Corynebacterium sp.]|uniref:hypothetical protein n=1 Tax=uncultured Corynebacterium sp. TaxID=159447 RepID=UPI0025E91FE5|nr:hypothetical protein [uncultured Corynebacterium sp.]
MSTTTRSRTARRIGIGLAAATLTAGLAAAPATAQDLPANSSGISAPNGWTPEASAAGWADMSGQVLAQALTNPEQALYSSILLPTFILASPILAGPPLFPFCGSPNTGQGCAGSPPAN